MSQVKSKKNLKGKKKLMYESLLKTMGNVSRSSEVVGVDRRTHYHWLERDDNYKAWVEELPERIVDFYETALNKLVNEGDKAAIIFALKCKGKHRGWVERSEVDARVSGGSELSVRFVEPDKDVDVVDDE